MQDNDKFGTVCKIVYKCSNDDRLQVDLIKPPSVDVISDLRIRTAFEKRPSSGEVVQSFTLSNYKLDRVIFEDFLVALKEFIISNY